MPTITTTNGKSYFIPSFCPVKCGLTGGCKECSPLQSGLVQNPILNQRVVLPNGKVVSVEQTESGYATIVFPHQGAPKEEYYELHPTLETAVEAKERMINILSDPT